MIFSFGGFDIANFFNSFLGFLIFQNKLDESVGYWMFGANKLWYLYLKYNSGRLYNF